jgi:hypothetical protein
MTARQRAAQAAAEAKRAELEAAHGALPELE